jgi:hypothetical protein
MERRIDRWISATQGEAKGASEMTTSRLIGNSYTVVGVGGFGRRVVSAARRRVQELEVPNCRLIAIDTDLADIEAAHRDGLDDCLLVSPEGDESFGDNRVENIMRYPDRFGGRDPSYFKDFLSCYGRAMDTLAIGAGAGTRPPFGEFIFRSHRWPVCSFLRRNLDSALTHARQVQHILVGSGGGGTSAPGILALAELLGTRDGLAECCNQGPDRVKKPWVATLPPLIQSEMADTQTFALRPLANAYAFTHELNVLARDKVVEYVFRLNTQNGHGAAVSTLDAAAYLLADVLVGIILGANTSASSWCDNFRIVRHDPERIGLRLK